MRKFGIFVSFSHLLIYLSRVYCYVLLLSCADLNIPPFNLRFFVPEITLPIPNIYHIINLNQ